MASLETTAKATPVAPAIDLLAAAKAGDSQAFQTLTQRAAPIIFHRALEITSNYHDAEDVLQETLLKGFAHISEFRGDSQLSTWLVRIGLNEAMMLMRKRRHNVPLVNEETATGTAESPAAFQREKPGNDAPMVRTEVRGLLDKALLRLPARARQVLHLRYLEGCSVEETARRLKLSRGSVKAYACRSRARMRKELRRLLMPRRKTSAGVRPQ
jgi:RNA polymerase sigma-70 factor, ECF subfamily